jgi:hypothetical protein
VNTEKQPDNEPDPVEFMTEEDAAMDPTVDDREDDTGNA